MRWLLAIAVGAGLGVAAGIADTVTGDPGLLMRALQVTTDTVAIWALAAIFGGWLLARQPWSVVAGPVVLVSGFGGWYLWLVTRPGVHASWDLVGAETRYWMLAAVVMGPLLGLIGGLARSNNLVGLCARITAPVALVAEVVRRHRISSDQFTVDPVVAWTSVLLVCLGILLIAVAVMGRQRSSQ